MATIRLTMAQALVRYLAAQRSEVDGQTVPLIAGVFAIFGHGNVAGLGEALEQMRDAMPTYRGHNEQSMAHAATAFAKANMRRRLMAVTTSIGPGATNLVTAAATAHVNRLPLLLLPGDVFADRFPDPVLQQLEEFGDPTLTVNDCLRPVSRYWDRITRPEQLMSSLPAAMRVLTDPADCGPVTLALPQDVQTEAFDFPEELFAERTHRWRRPPPDAVELEAAVAALRGSTRPLIVAGGGVHYSLACEALDAFAARFGIPVSETQAGKGALVWNHAQLMGSIGVTGTSASNRLAAEADVVLAIGTRLADFTTASRTLFEDPKVRFVGLNVAAFDAVKHGGQALVCDAREGMAALTTALGDWQAPAWWGERAKARAAEWNQVVDRVTAASSGLPTDAQVLGAVNRKAEPGDAVVGAAGGLPGELHKLWRVGAPGGYHLEYGYSCMGYEIAGGLGVRMARDRGCVFVLVGDGSYLMANSEIVTSVCLGQKLIIVLLDNHGFGCINRLQRSCGGAPFNNLLEGPNGNGPPRIDFVAHASAMGATGIAVANLEELEAAVVRARASDGTHVIVIETDPQVMTTDGGAWWDVAVAQTSNREEVRHARREYERARQRERVGRS
ncbi:MAG: 3D-(3,5/4)-trihydroxycyclohexane-1,2-dione acylhydrolase (decyclizing) [Myxococcota bacterium]